jgi:MoaA/NifB/PqqE/SkfB family radical SAM enzyme
MRIAARPRKLETKMLSTAHRIARAFVARRIDLEVDLVPFRLEDLPLKKVVNWLLTESSVTFKPARPWGMPAILQLEPTNSCNLKCPGCPSGGEMDRGRGFMDPELFRSLVDELADYLLVMLFWDWGEPFLHPNAYEMIAYARKAGIRLASSTNGHVFAEGDHARRLVDSGLDVAVFSVDGIRQESYQRYRAAGNLETVKDGIRRVVAEKRRAGSPTPHVNLRFIAMEHNEDELAALHDFAAGLGVDSVTVRKFAKWGRVEDLAPASESHQMPDSPPGEDLRTRVRRNRCRNLWNCPTIHWDGSVCRCFMDWNGRHPLGSIGRASLRSTWFGPAYGDLRRDFRRRWRELPLCGECSCGYAGGDVATESNVEFRLVEPRDGSPGRRGGTAT